MLVPFWKPYDESTIIVTGAKGYHLYTTEGELLDFSGCYGAVIFAHAAIPPAPRYASTLFTQLHPSAIVLDELLCERTGYTQTFLGLSGSAVCEVAIRTMLSMAARKRAAANIVLVLHNGYHGSSVLGLAASAFAECGLESMRTVVQPHVLGQWVFDESCSNPGAALAAEKIDWSRVAGVIFEPVQATGGGRVFSRSAYELIAQRCHSFGGFVIADEVFTGCMRTGEFLETQSWDPRPDMVLLGKGITNGQSPLAVLLANDKVKFHVKNELYGSTLSGLSEATSLAVLVLQFLQPTLAHFVAEKSKALFERIATFSKQMEGVIIHSQGKGLLFGITFASRELALAVVTRCIENGLYLTAEGRTVVFSPALDMPNELLDQGFNIFCVVVKTVCRRK